MNCLQIQFRILPFPASPPRALTARLSRQFWEQSRVYGVVNQVWWKGSRAHSVWAWQQEDVQ